jgi:hypothetical protein
MDEQPMTLLGTTGSSNEAPVESRHQVYMSQDGDLVRWVGKLEQPQIHAIYRTYFNAVDVNNKLALGPRSVSSLSSTSLPLKIWLATLAIGGASAYLMYAKRAKLTSDAYSHSDFKCGNDDSPFTLRCKPLPHVMPTRQSSKVKGAT